METCPLLFDAEKELKNRENTFFRTLTRETNTDKLNQLMKNFSRAHIEILESCHIAKNQDRMKCTQNNIFEATKELSCIVDTLIMNAKHSHPNTKNKKE